MRKQSIMNALQDCKRKEAGSQDPPKDGNERTMLDMRRRYDLEPSLEAAAKKHRGQEALRRTKESTCGSSDFLSDLTQTSDIAVESYLPTKKADDPFLYYSSHKRRMEHLIGREMPNLSLEPVVGHRSRISFELDPFFDLMTTFPELEGEGFEEEVQG